MKSVPLTLTVVALVAAAAGGLYLTPTPRAAGVPVNRVARDRSEASEPQATPVTQAWWTPARADQVVLEIERALVSSDREQRETAFTYLLPELLAQDAARATTLFARQEPGEARDALRDELARQWIRSDRDAAADWMTSLDEAERRSAATTAVRSLAAGSPAQAIELADRFGVGRDDGSLEHLVQIWATADPAAARSWVASRPPDDPRTAQLRARIETVLAARVD